MSLLSDPEKYGFKFHCLDTVTYLSRFERDEVVEVERLFDVAVSGGRKAGTDTPQEQRQRPTQAGLQAVTGNERKGRLGVVQRFVS